MIIITVVGVRKSGKTTTVTGLIEEFKRRGMTVGTVKSVFCPTFSMDEKGSNSWKHKQAGADMVFVKAKREMDLFLPPEMEEQIYSSLPLDMLILEGDYELAVPRIICAHKELEVEERKNAYTLAVTGRIADKTNGECLGYPIFHPLQELKALADYILEHTGDATFPLQRQKMPDYASGFCQCGCHKNEKKLAQAAETVELKENPAHPYCHIFLTGEKQVGKSTLLGKLRERMAAKYKLEEAGYETRPYFIGETCKGYVFHSLTSQDAYKNNCPITVRVSRDKMQGIPQSFDTTVLELLRETRQEQNGKTTLWILDEIGRAEGKAVAFQQEIYSLLDEEAYCFGVLQRNCDFPGKIAGRSDVKVYEVTEENRDALEEEIWAELCRMYDGGEDLCRTSMEEK